MTPVPLRAALPAALAAAALLACTPHAQAADATPGGALFPVLDSQECGGGFQCAMADVLRDYDRPNGATIQLALLRQPASDQKHRIGTLFLNPGGPGGSGVEFLRTAPPPMRQVVGRRFDLVGFDPRGVGSSVPAIHCIPPAHPQPLMRPETLDIPALVQETQERAAGCVAGSDPSVLPTLTTGNVARDLDLLRAAVGDRRLTYYGGSYGTLIGETYATLFPDHVRALALDSLMDGEVWLNHPLERELEQFASFESSLDRFFATCAVHQDVCRFGGDDPEAAFDTLLEHADQEPLPAPNAADHTPVSGDELRLVAFEAMYAKVFCAPLARALSQAEAGDGSGLRDLAGSPGLLFPQQELDAFYVYTANEARYPHRIDPFIEHGFLAFGLFEHFAPGQFEIADAAFWPFRPKGAFIGPFEYPAGRPPILAFQMTHDPATPSVWAKHFVADLGNTRLLTMQGDGHGVLRTFDPCVLQPFIAYIERGELPPAGATCVQHILFE